MSTLSSIDLGFERDPRRQQEIRLRPRADEVYKLVWGNDIEIKRFNRDIILDKIFAIDVQVTLRTGQILLGQEKFLSAKYSKFNSLTVEYMQNANEKGDWFKLAAQFYFTGYEAEVGFIPWVIANWPAIVLATYSGQLKWRYNDNKDGHAQADFKYVDIDTLPDNCIIAKSNVEYMRHG